MKYEQFSIEKAFNLALQRCTVEKDILEAVKQIENVGTNFMYGDEFIQKYTTLEYCYGCQVYHDTTEVSMAKGMCSPQVKLDAYPDKIARVKEKLKQTEEIIEKEKIKRDILTERCEKLSAEYSEMLITYKKAQVGISK